MRKLFFIASLLVCLMSVNAFAQDKPTAPTTVTVTEQPKNVVERAVEEAKERGEKVVGACLVDCGDAKKRGEGETVKFSSYRNRSIHRLPKQLTRQVLWKCRCW